MHGADDGEPEDRLVGLDRVAADDGDAGLRRLVGRPARISASTSTGSFWSGKPTRLSAVSGLPPIA